MSLITATGTDALHSATEQKVDFKKVYIRLKDGESVRVRLLGITDKTVGEFKAHGDFNKGIYTAPCIAPTGEECPYCVAANSGVEGWEKFYARKRYLLLFADIDSQTIRAWDASKQQGESMLKLMEEYADSIDDMAFTFKRTGSNAQDTSYNLIPILKLKPEDKEKFEAAANIEIPNDFFDQILVPRSKEQMIKNLEQAGFPVSDFFGEESKKEEAVDDPFDKVSETLDISEEELPF